MRIAIDIGHNCNYDTGAVGILSEDVANKEVGTRVIEKLRNLRHEVITCEPVDPSSVVNSLYQRTEKANNANVDVFCSIHCNCGGGTGTEVFAGSRAGMEIAERIAEAVSSGLGLTNRGIKDGSHLYVIKHTKAVAVLVECLFVDSQQDASRYDAEIISDAIVQGLVGGSVVQAPKENNPRLWFNIPKLQENLNTLKIKDYEGKALEVDGLLGVRTQSAIKKLQKVLDLEVDGIAGSKTMVAINSILAKSTQQIDSFSENPTRYIQFRVSAYVDGIFGTNTAEKVANFQSQNFLQADGIVGPNTWNALLQE